MFAPKKISGINNVGKKWVREVIILSTFFIITTSSGWRGITNEKTFWQASVYFSVLYIHALLQRKIWMPVFFERRWSLLNTFYSLLLLLTFSGLLYIVGVYWIYDFLKSKALSPQMYIFHAGTCTLSLIAFMGVFIVVQYYDDEKERAVTAISKKETELNLLHSQLNPHFLFNTFNSLYAISLNEPEKMPDFILQVTKLMRYHLQSYSLHLTSLADELSFIEAYIDLEEERFGQQCDITYSFKHEAGYEQYNIVPLVLFTFIENAFKHGVNTTAHSFVHIQILVKKNTLELEVINSATNNNIATEHQTRIGQRNAIRRLSLLYGSKYQLTILPQDEKYYVRLLLPLTARRDEEV